MVYHSLFSAGLSAGCGPPTTPDGRSCGCFDHFCAAILERVSATSACIRSRVAAPRNTEEIHEIA
jgi:hypothetical protein